MAQIMEGGGGDHGKHGKKRAKKHSSHVDMTPMVDLGFLLLTFFVLTTQFSKPKTMEINMPVEPKDTTNRTKIDDETALTLLLTDKKDKIYYYYGKFKPETAIIKTNLSVNSKFLFAGFFNKKSSVNRIIPPVIQRATQSAQT